MSNVTHYAMKTPRIRAIHVARNFVDGANAKATIIGYGFSLITLATVTASHLG
jgi:hypothetical protein